MASRRSAQISFRGGLFYGTPQDLRSLLHVHRHSNTMMHMISFVQSGMHADGITCTGMPVS
jgi:hypothetical protein